MTYKRRAKIRGDIVPISAREKRSFDLESDTECSFGEERPSCDLFYFLLLLYGNAFIKRRVIKVSLE